MKVLSFEPPEPFATQIGQSVILNGKLRSNLPLSLRCTLRGSIEGTFVRIERSAHIEANSCTVQNAVIAGCFTGRLKAVDSLVFLPSSHISADIYTARLQIIEGATFEGGIEMPGFSATDDVTGTSH